MSAPPGEEDAVYLLVADDGDRMLALPLSWKAAADQQRRAKTEVASCPVVGPQEQRQPFRTSEAADEHQHRQFRVIEDAQISVAVAHRPHHTRLVPPARLRHKPGPKELSTFGAALPGRPEPLLVYNRRRHH